MMPAAACSAKPRFAYPVQHARHMEMWTQLTRSIRDCKLHALVGRPGMGVRACLMKAQLGHADLWNVNASITSARAPGWTGQKC